MKKLFTLLSLLAVPAVAQPTFTTLAIPANNTAVSSRSVAYTGVFPTAGANQTWDYSALSFTNAATSNVAHTNLSDSPRGSSFPTASYYEVAADGAEIFYKVTSTSSSVLGNYSAANGGVTIVNSDPQTTLTVPFSYGETQTDTYAGDYVANSIPVSKSGSLQVDYNGYGTLKTPDGTYTNVPMLTAVADETHTFQVTEDFSYPQRFVSTTYSWGYPGAYSFIFAIIKIEVYTFGTLSGTSINALKTEQIPTGIFNTSNANVASVFPQPAKDQVTISSDKLHGQYNATIYNLQGDVLQSQEGNAADQAFTMNVQSLTKGIYLVEVNNDGQLLRTKLVVQ
ncbi:MAG: Por secretion system C-terminal sorting domain containing protein [Chitinophagaceae bacterium]|nr:Por secretion system C-terminal sorting domain containing protein [Chitinophagaceae bacterium]